MDTNFLSKHSAILFVVYLKDTITSREEDNLLIPQRNKKWELYCIRKRVPTEGLVIIVAILQIAQKMKKNCWTLEELKRFNNEISGNGAEISNQKEAWSNIARLIVKGFLLVGLIAEKCSYNLKRMLIANIR